MSRLFCLTVRYQSPRRRSLQRLWIAVPLLALISAVTIVPSSLFNRAIAQTSTDRRPLTLQADIQEANAKTGVLTARGNVQIDYPARGIRATAAQAQYFSRERRIILSGNVYINQEGNTLRGETVTYLIDEGRFIALPGSDKQVQSIYQVEEAAEDAQPTPAPGVAPF